MKKLLLTTALAVVGVLSAASGANAAGHEVTVCVTQGTAGIANPGIQNIKDDASDSGGLLDKETGTYSFGVGAGQNATCVEASADGEFVPAEDIPAPSNTHIESTGSYENQVCGTGTADGTATVTTSAGGGDVVNASYHIDFYGGNGASNPGVAAHK